MCSNILVVVFVNVKWLLSDVTDTLSLMWLILQKKKTFVVSTQREWIFIQSVSVFVVDIFFTFHSVRFRTSVHYGGPDIFFLTKIIFSKRCQAENSVCEQGNQLKRTTIQRPKIYNTFIELLLRLKYPLKFYYTYFLYGNNILNLQHCILRNKFLDENIFVEGYGSLSLSVCVCIPPRGDLVSTTK